MVYFALTLEMLIKLQKHEASLSSVFGMISLSLIGNENAGFTIPSLGEGTGGAGRFFFCPSSGCV